MRLVRYILLVLLMAVVVPRAEAQYYSWGADAPMRWQERTGDRVSVIAPDTAAAVAARTLHYINAVQPFIGEGFRYGPMEIPYVIHPENADANALVIYLPKRVDFRAQPAIESYSMPWLKQLVAHEYRHAVQYNNLNRGVPRVLSLLLGEQGSITGLLFMPLWAIEGDAVMNETLMSSYGRGLQPSFSMVYRAEGERIGRTHNGKRRKNIDRWFCGSYLDPIPDHYALGYQLSRYAYDRYGENIWDQVGRYGVRNPYLLAPTHFGLKKYYNTSTKELFTNTFTALNRHWAPLAAVEENSRPLVALDTTDYTTYRWPLQLSEAEVLAVRTSYASTPRLVTLDSQGNEREVARVGQLSSRPALHRDTLYWTEYEQSLLFEERVGSQLWRMSLDEEQPQRVAEVRNALYPTSSEEGLAWIAYRPEGRYALIVAGRERVVLPVGTELHGLAWDNRTKQYYVLVTDDDGMYPARIDREGLTPLRAAAYITLSNLRAADGVLYYGSIDSGRDEVHGYDLASQREYRLSQSKYGAFDPAPSPYGLLMTRYERRGYAVARIDKPLNEEVAERNLPTNLVNPAQRGWPTVNLDTVHFTAAAAAAIDREAPARRYRKAAKAVKVHSWAPVAFNPFRAVDEHALDFNVGATLLSQNLLSNTEGYASYGWNEREGSQVDVGVIYKGLGVELGLDLRYGGEQQAYSLASYDDKTGSYAYQPLPRLGTYHSATLSAHLPLLFDRGANLRQLTLSTAWNYSNGEVADLEAIEWKENKITNVEQLGYRKGLHKLTFGLSYSIQHRLAHRDFMPSLGCQVAASYGLNPTNSNFASLATLFGRLWLPGILPHNSIEVAASYQNSIGGYRFPNGYRPLMYCSSQLTPRGYTSAEIVAQDYSACSLNYRLPLCYPEWGISSLLYIKRIRLGVGYDAAQFNYRGNRYALWSVGGEVAFDFNLLRMPSAATSSLTISCFRPKKGGSWISASLGLPF